VKAEFTDGKITLGPEGKALYTNSGYGRPAGKRLALSGEEALYLLGRDKIELDGYDFDTLASELSEDSKFMRRFLLYRDIRERGYVIQAGPHDFRVFRRGEKPGTGRSQFMIRVLAERDLVGFNEVLDDIASAKNMRKQFLVGVVDDEDEITYYEVKSNDIPEGVAENRPEPFTGILYGRSVVIKTPPESSLEKAWFGTRLDKDRLLLSPPEVLYLLERELLKIRDTDISSFSEIAAEEDHEIESKYVVYKDLREKRQIARTAYKFGHHFRVYSGEKKHSELLVHALPSEEFMPMSVISRSVRLAHSVRKKMLFASVDKKNIEYIEFARIKM
jgi:tRNA-intron endonuclease